MAPFVCTVCLSLVFLVLPGAGKSDAEAEMTITQTGHMKKARIMRHDSTQHESTPSGYAPAVNPALFHQFDAGGNCPTIDSIKYPIRQEAGAQICLDDNTKSLGVSCDAQLEPAGQNRVVYAYQGKVNETEVIKRYGKVFIPKDGDTNKPNAGWPVMIIFHASLPLYHDSLQADDAKAPENHFDGILSTLEGPMEKMVVIVPAGFERYRYDGPPYNDCDATKYMAEFNYLGGSVGRTRHSNADDIRFLSKILEYLKFRTVIDLGNVFITGHSTGAHMSFYLMSQHLAGTVDDPVEFPVAGGAASAGSFLTCLTDPRIARGQNANWVGLGPRPFMYFQGLQDVHSWCGGGGHTRHQGEHLYTLEQMAFAFAERNNCGTTSDGYFRMKQWELTGEQDADLSESRAHLWEFRNCDAPLVIYTFPNLDNGLQVVNKFMYKRKFEFFLKEWTPPADGGLDMVLNTKNGTNICGCCSQENGKCDYTSRCDGQQYLQSVSCPSVSETSRKCWHSGDLQESPVCWWTENLNDEEEDSSPITPPPPYLGHLSTYSPR